MQAEACTTEKGIVAHNLLCCLYFGVIPDLHAMATCRGSGIQASQTFFWILGSWRCLPEDDTGAFIIYQFSVFSFQFRVLSFLYFYNLFEICNLIFGFCLHAMATCRGLLLLVSWLLPFVPSLPLCYFVFLWDLE